MRIVTGPSLVSYLHVSAEDAALGFYSDVGEALAYAIYERIGLFWSRGLTNGACPFRVSAYSVNWLTTRTDAPSSRTERFIFLPHREDAQVRDLLRNVSASVSSSLP